jgi:hypothetical protein
VSDKTNSLPALPPKPVRLLQYLWYHLRHALPSGRRRHSPIFIVGCGHSGTSLMLRMLGAHSNIHAIADETWAANGAKDKVFKRYARNFDKSAAMAWRLRWLEKTPKHVHEVAFLRRHCPDALFVGMVRDPRDVSNSLKKRFGSLTQGIDRWNEDNQALLSHVGEPWLYLVRYEDLIADPRSTLTGIMRFLGESMEEQQLQFHRNAVNRETRVPTDGGEPAPQDNTALRKWQVNQPLFDGRGKWERELTPSEVEEVVERTRELAEKFGYHC